MRGPGQRSPGGGDVDLEVTANLGICGALLVQRNFQHCMDLMGSKMVNNRDS